MDEMDNRSVMQYLIDNGADVNARNKYGFTPLHVAVLSRNRCVIDILIQSGADINIKSCLKRTALHFAISNYQPKQFKRTLPLNDSSPDMWMVRKLLDQENISVNVGDIRGDTPLMWAVMEKQVVTVTALLNKGANPNIRNKDSSTPLHIALSAQNPCPYIVVNLLFHRASLNVADKEGKTPIDILIQNVRNTQCYQFAYTCLETIAFSHHVKKHQEEKLEILPQLLQRLKNCRIEVGLMKFDIIADSLTVFRFMLLGVNHLDFEIPAFEIYKRAVERLLSGVYSEYLHNILEHIPKSYLCIILENTIYAKDCEEASNIEGCEEMPDAQKCRKRKPADIFSKVDIFKLSEYLSRLDVFCLIVALSKGKIPESMRHIRERKL